MQTPLNQLVIQSIQRFGAQDRQLRQRQLLNMFITITLLIGVIYVTANPIYIFLSTGQFSLNFLLVDLLALGVLAVLRLLNRRGYTRLAALGYIFLLVLLPHAVFAPKTQDSVLILYTLPIVFSSFIIAPYASWIVSGGATIAYTLVLVQADRLNAFNFTAFLTFFTLAALSWLIAASFDHLVVKIETDRHLYSTLVEHSPSVVYIAEGGRAGHWTYISPQVEQLLGFTPQEWLSVPNRWLEQILPEDRLRILDEDAQIHSLKTTQRCEYRVRSRSGEIRWVRDDANLLLTPPLGRIQGVIMDISVRKEMEFRLRESEDRYRTLITASPDAITVTDLNGVITYASKRAHALFLTDESRGEGLGTSIFDWVAPSDRPLAQQQASRITSGRESIPNIYEFVRKDGVHFFGEVSSAVLRGLNGEITGIIATIRDISRRKKDESLQEALYQISEAAYSTDSLEDLYARIHAILGTLMHAENFFIANYDSKTETIYFPYFVDAYDDKPAPRKPGRTLTDYVLRTGQPILAYPMHFEHLRETGEVVSQGTASVDWMGVPLKYKGESLGIMAVQSYTEGIRFDQEDLQIMTFVSNQVALAIARKRAEEALRESNQLNQEVISGAKIGIFLLDTDLKVLIWNPVMENLTSLPAREAVGSPILELFPRLDEIGIGGQLLQALSGKTIFLPDQYVLFSRTQRPVWISSIFAPHRSAQGQIAGVIGVISNITERKQFEDALRFSENLYHTTLDALQEWIHVVDSDLNLILANQSLRALLHPSNAHADIYGQSVEKAFPFLPAQHHLDDQEILKTGHALFSTERIEIDQHPYFTETLKVPVLEEGQVARVITVIRDITAQKEAEEQIRTALHEKEILLQEIHHRVKNNLQVMSSLLGLQTDFIQDPRALEVIQATQSRIRSMALIHEELYQSKDLAHINMVEYLQKLSYSLVNAFASHPGIHLQVEIEDIFFGVDTATPCGLIVNELVSNALKYAFPHGQKGTVRVVLHADPEQAGKHVLVVADDGVGLPAGLDFQNTDTLGLQLVNILSQQLKGSIHLQTRPGTIFTLRF
ncbi:PAS domain-containing protein [Levilinea saccharolytica]|uniref:PAS domain S-box protein n=1 Tax=Levilinea saccharolytica TaxID=229921 RepID=A0A0P6YEZ8_9CHLR|nr:PAS domain-containing protein [Levilinea saccharolytica]KPL80716.1 hypothetical protein ADN01_11355 [Levilinea saccharolytica]GAP17212.1 protein containing PAS domain S-box [Levilinea saccharolytica]